METLDTIQGQIQRHLTAEHMKHMSGVFGALRDDAARVFFAYDLLERLNLFPELIGVEKCDEQSDERRNYGNHVFKLKKNSDALKQYNKAVACAQTDERLSLAFGNRSAVLFQKKMFPVCVIDIQNALRLTPPQKVLSKLLERKIRALESPLEPIDDYFMEIPEISEKHSKIQAAASSVEIKNSDTLGRHIIATRDIEPGEVIAIEAPFTVLLLRNFYLSHCCHCLQPSCNLIPCVKCPLTLYCSEKCRQISWDLYHRYECPILDTLHFINATKLQLLALRVVLKLGSQIDAPIPPPGDVYKSGSYPEIHCLITNEGRRTVSDLFSRATVAATFLYLLEKTAFFRDFTSPISARENCASLLLKHLQTAPSNMHEISEMQGSNGFEIVEIGAGAYAFLSLLNHSCCPNVARHCHGTVMVLRAIKSIKTGEQLYDNYGYHFAIMEKSERQSHLKEQYLFDCECEACVNDYPLYTDLSKGHNKFVVKEDELNELVAAKRSTALKLLPILLNNAKEFEMNPIEKRVEILDNQEVMKQCFAIFGNKNTLY